jgi:succinate dehydrogenase/fumarate reductase flavoprotein subunit
MDLTAGNRTTVTAAAVVLVTGLAAILYGVMRGDPAHSTAGVGLTATALTLVALTSIRRWVTNTTDERRQLADATQAARDERDGYFAAKAVLENDQQRLMRAAAADRAHAAATLIVERGKMAAEFEEKRAALVCETLAAYDDLMRSQKQKPPERSSVIPFPIQQPERERSRGHNVVGP